MRCDELESHTSRAAEGELEQRLHRAGRVAVAAWRTRLDSRSQVHADVPYGGGGQVARRERQVAVGVAGHHVMVCQSWGGALLCVETFDSRRDRNEHVRIGEATGADLEMRYLLQV